MRRNVSLSAINSRNTGEISEEYKKNNNITPEDGIKKGKMSVSAEGGER